MTSPPTNTRIVATIEARMTSSRLPGKVLKEWNGRPMLELMIERLRHIRSLDHIVIATTVNPDDDPVVALAERLGIGHFRGSEDNVMERVLHAAQAHHADIIFETTGDCPLIDPAICEQVIADYFDNGVDYAGIGLERSYPLGMDVQVFSTTTLADAYSRTDDPVDHEHVSLFIYRHPELYKLHNRKAPDEYFDPTLRLTLDTIEDYRVIAAIYDALYGEGRVFPLSEILSFLKDHPEVRAISENIQHRYL